MENIIILCPGHDINDRRINRTNDILIKVSNKVNGNLYSTGDVILLKKSTIIDLETHFTGKILTNY